MSDTPLTGPLQRLIDELKKLPGVGPRSAERIAFHLLKAEKVEALAALWEQWASSASRPERRTTRGRAVRERDRTGSD